MDGVYEWLDPDKVAQREAWRDRVSNVRTSLAGGAYVGISIGHLFKGLRFDWVSGTPVSRQYENNPNSATPKAEEAIVYDS